MIICQQLDPWTYCLPCTLKGGKKHAQITMFCIFVKSNLNVMSTLESVSNSTAYKYGRRQQQQQHHPTVSFNITFTVNTFRRQMLMNLLYSQTPKSCTVLWAYLISSFSEPFVLFQSHNAFQTLWVFHIYWKHYSFACIPSCITYMKAFIYFYFQSSTCCVKLKKTPAWL